MTRTLGMVGHPIFQRHPSLRWLAPAGILGIAVVAATGVLQAGASSEDLPTTTPAALIAAVQAPDAPGFSGTVVSRIALGLPELPVLGGSSDGASMASLVTGTHTLQVWYGSSVKQRIALLGATQETDVFRNGRQLWQWNSADRVAVHTVLPAEAADPQSSASQSAALSASPSTVTPESLARQALESIEPSTQVIVHENRQVADRTAYELVLRPRSTTTRVGSVHVEIDGATKVPLGVQVYPRGSDTPAIDVSYTSIHFVQPADTYFRFSPPTGAHVHTQRAGSALGRLAERLEHPFPSTGQANPKPAGRTSISHRISVSGAGWSSVIEYVNGKPLSVPSSLGAIVSRVHGSWGKGRLLDTRLVCVLVTDGGRVYAGAVDPSALYAAAGRK